MNTEKIYKNSYGNQLEIFKSRDPLVNATEQDIINFITGKGHISHPSFAHISELIGIVNANGLLRLADSDTFIDPWAQDYKSLRDSLVYSKDGITADEIINLWDMAKRRKTRTLQIAGGALAGVAIGCGIAYAISKKSDTDYDEWNEEFEDGDSNESVGIETATGETALETA